MFEAVGTSKLVTHLIYASVDLRICKWLLIGLLEVYSVLICYYEANLKVFMSCGRIVQLVISMADPRTVKPSAFRKYA